MYEGLQSRNPDWLVILNERVCLTEKESAVDGPSDLAYSGVWAFNK